MYNEQGPTFTSLVLGCDQKLQINGCNAILSCIPHNSVEILQMVFLWKEKYFQLKSQSRVMAAKWLLVNAWFTGLQPEIDQA